MTGGVGLAVAFGAGLASFLSPCVLPLVPGYLSFLGGMVSTDAPSRRSRLAYVFPAAALFVLGFSVVFVALGVSASLLGGLFSGNRDVISRVSGAVIVVFGVLMLQVVRIPWLYGEARFDPARTRVLGAWAAPVMGAAFAFAWTPCVGPILGSILMLAAGTGRAGEAALLLGAYSVGLGIPFLALALLVGKAAELTKRMGRHSLVISRVSGTVLIVLGVLIVTDTLDLLTAFLSRWIPVLGG